MQECFNSSDISYLWLQILVGLAHSHGIGMCGREVKEVLRKWLICFRWVTTTQVSWGGCVRKTINFFIKTRRNILFNFYILPHSNIVERKYIFFINNEYLSVYLFLVLCVFRERHSAIAASISIVSEFDIHTQHVKPEEMNMITVWWLHCLRFLIQKKGP